jgi:ribonuclease P/MRP protein subunit RPP1
MRGFCDLNLPFDLDGSSSGGDDFLAKIAQLAKLGYDTIAVNVNVSQDQLTTKSKQNQNKRAKLQPGAKDLMLDFPTPPKVELKAEDFVGEKGPPTVLTRLTIAFRDNNFLPVFNQSLTAKAYDLIAVCPANAQALQNLLKSSMVADIVTFTPENAADVRWTRKLYMECIERHMYFELCYAPCIRDGTARRRIIAQSHNYHSVGKSKNIVICSGAERVIELRGPYDAANLGFLFGLNEHQGKLAVGAMALEAVRAAAGRKVGPYRVTVEKVDFLKEEDKWKVSNPVEEEESSSEESSEEEEEEEAEAEADKGGFGDVMV